MRGPWAIASLGLMLAAAPLGLAAQEEGASRLTVFSKMRASSSKSRVDALALAPVVRNYKFLADAAVDPDVRAEALQRLGDLFMDITEQKQLMEVEQAAAEADEAIMQYAASDLELVAPPPSYHASIELYETLVDDYPDYPRIGDALYQLAKAYDLVGDKESSLLTLNRLVETVDKDSTFYVEAQFRRGEIYFEFGDYALAEQAYKLALVDRRNNPFYDKSKYKYGWSRFKLSEYKPALKQFFSLLDDLSSGFKDVRKMSPGDRALMEDTYRVISMSFGYVGGAKAVTAWFEDYGRRIYEPDVYRSFGDQLIKQNRYIEAADAFQEFIKIHPNHEQIPLFQAGVIRAYEEGRYTTKEIPAKEFFAKSYRTSSKFWSTASDHLKQEVERLLRKYLPDLGRFYHARAQQRRKQVDYRKAALWYREFLSVYPDADNAAEINFLLAEDLFESKSYVAAAQEYEKVAYNYPEYPKRSESAYAAIQAYDLAAKQLKGSALEDIQRKGIAAGERFAEHFGSDQRYAQVLARTAEEQLVVKQPAEAAVTARKILAMEPPPDQKLLRRAWTALAHGSFESGAYAEAEQAYNKALTLEQRPKRVAQLQERLGASIYHQGEAAHKAGDYAEALAQFKRVEKAVPGADMVANARFDAATVLIDMSDWVRAVAALETFKANYPKHELLATMPEKLAIAYEGAKRWDKAAEQMLLIAKREGKTPLGGEAMYSAAEMFAKGERYGRAIDTYKQYVRTYPKPLEVAIEARNKLAGLYVKTGETRKRVYWLKQIVKAHRQAGKAQSPRTQFLAAGASFDLAEINAKSFESIRLTLPLVKSLARKQKAMDRAIKAYGAAAEFGTAQYTAAATFRIAQIYQRLGSDILGSERPTELNAAELEQYDFLLEDEAFPFEEKAIEVHEVNTARAKEGIYDKWVRQSFDALAQILPARYAKRERHEEPMQTPK